MYNARLTDREPPAPAASHPRPGVHAHRAEAGRDIPRIGRARRTVPGEAGVSDVRRSRQVQPTQQPGVRATQQVKTPTIHNNTSLLTCTNRAVKNGCRGSV